MLGEVELVLLRRDSSDFPSHPSPLAEWHFVPIRSTPCTVPPERGLQGERAVPGAAGWLRDGTCELGGSCTLPVTVSLMGCEDPSFR